MKRNNPPLATEKGITEMTQYGKGTNVEGEEINW